jgi:TonB family protein
MSTPMIGRQLFESAPLSSRGARPIVASTAAHAVLVTFTVWATLDARPADRAKAMDKVEIVELAVFRPPAVAAASTPARSRAPRGFQVLVAPREMPATLSLADLSAPTTIPEDFTGRGQPGGVGVSIAAVSFAASGRSGDPIDHSVADEPPYMLPGQMGPAYPDLLRTDGPDGLVVVRFVVDTLGKVERPSLDVLAATHPLFLASVRTALERLRFLPASFSGRRVRVRMEQRFEFHLAGR